ncbi:hypothetical protein Trydic_g4176 [Trypoxylus dichotomus]
MEMTAQRHETWQNIAIKRFVEMPPGLHRVPRSERIQQRRQGNIGNVTSTSRQTIRQQEGDRWPADNIVSFGGRLSRVRNYRIYKPYVTDIHGLSNLLRAICVRTYGSVTKIEAECR